MSFGFYADQDLTTPLTLSNPLLMTFNVANGGQAVDVQIWFGSPQTGKKVVPTAPDFEIKVNVIDSTTGNGHDLDPVNGPYFVLASTQADLDTAQKNTELVLGTEVLGGVNNAVSFWLRIYEPEQMPNIWDDFRLVTNELAVMNI